MLDSAMAAVPPYVSLHKAVQAESIPSKTPVIKTHAHHFILFFFQYKRQIMK